MAIDTFAKTFTFVAPAAWAAPLFYSDLSGLDFSGPEAVAEFERWCDTNPDKLAVCGCTDIDQPFNHRFNGEDTDCVTYTAWVRNV